MTRRIPWRYKAAAHGPERGLVGGRISDRVGRKPVILAAGTAQAALPALLLLPGGGVRSGAGCWLAPAR